MISADACQASAMRNFKSDTPLLNGRHNRSHFHLLQQIQKASLKAPTIIRRVTENGWKPQMSSQTPPPPTDQKPRTLASATAAAAQNYGRQATVF
jgi:hypothetical protein